MADQFEEIIGLRVAALEAGVAAEAESVKEHFVELQKFITFTVTTQVAQLKAELARDIHGVEQRLGGRIDALEQRFDGLERRFDGLEQRFDGLERRFGGLEQRFDGLEQRSDGLEQRFDRLEHKVDAQHEAIKLVLADILDRLPARRE